VRIIAVKTLREYWEIHRDIEGHLRAWYHRAKKVNWKTPDQVKKDYPTASIVADNRVVFDITKNYRLVVKIRYNRGIIYIRFIGTHQEYDRIDVTKI
jgi:mRNA interferase HigB